MTISSPISSAPKSGGLGAFGPESAPLPGETLSEGHLQELGAALGLLPSQIDNAARSLLQQWWMSGAELPPDLQGLLSKGEGLPSLPVWVQGRTGSGVERLPATFDLPRPALGPSSGGDADPGSLQPKRLIASMRINVDLDVAPRPETFFKSVTAAVSPVVNGLDQLLTSSAGAAVENLQAVASQARQALPPVLTQNLLSMPIPQKVGDPAWGQAMADRLVWMVRGEQQSAELKITPPNLGPLEVKLSINNDQASVSFVSNHAAVRDAIEAALPRLREMMEQQSLNLADVDVGDGRDRGEQADDSANTRGSGGTGDADELAETDQVTGDAIAARVGLGLVDLFA